ncbi:glycosyltransferase family 2 protein [Actinopolymorpha alba]|uniref:glycosyltransferase family 2 protein n=1 Tax=Actinopolymorpha alba TaxID=533267 RepID=UPI00192C6DCE|nr:glycosyltransferase [Actinopolymorpha alba]
MSVIVPVYNPGPYIEDCIGSLLRQSLSDEEYEAIFVDDGSTDETPARLDALAADHPHMRVIHQENSGWSGKPRNVGIEAARGEYVFFVDNDDWIGDEALERMYTFATKNGADVVIGKMAGKGRGVPRELFRRSYDRATLANAPLIDSLTPHKMFRKAFLDEHQLRFPEGRRRLEDHVFVTAAFFAAKTISVLSDYVCYYHVRRDDDSNAGFQRLEPKGYFANLSEALDIVEKNTEPGSLRDRLYRRWYRVEMIERLRGRRLLQVPSVDRVALFEEIRQISGARFGPGVAAGLPPSQRVVSALIQADRLDDLARLAAWEETIRHHARLDDLGWHGGSLRLALTGELRAGSVPLTFVHRDGRDLFAPPLPEATSASLPEEDLDSTERLNQSKVDVILRSRETAAEYFLPVTFTSTRRPVTEGGDHFRLLLHAEAKLDPATAGGGSPLARGIWDVIARITSCGWTKDTRLGSLRSPAAADHCVPAVLAGSAGVVTPYWTDKGNLSVDVGQKTSRLEHELVVPAKAQVRMSGKDLTLVVPLQALVGQARSDAAVRFVAEESSTTVEVDATLTPAVHGGTAGAELSARLDRDHLTPGRWSVEVRLVDTGHGRFVKLPLTVTAPAGSGQVALDLLSRPGRTPDGHQDELREPNGFGGADMSAALRGTRRLARRVRTAVAGRIRKPSR